MDKRTRQLLYIPVALSAWLFIWAIMDFQIRHHSRRRPFLFDGDFIAPFLRYVAGPIDCLASLVTQLYFYPWLGALIIFAVLVTIFISTTVVLLSFRQMSEKSVERPFFQVAVLPAAMGLFLLAQHISVFPLLSFAFSLGMAAVYVGCSFLSVKMRPALFAGMAIIVSYVSGGTVLLLTLICALYEFFRQRQRLPALGYLVFGASIHFVICTVLFEPNRMLQFFIGAPLEASSPDFHPLETIWYAIVPVVIVGTVYAKHLQRVIRVLRVSGIVAVCLMGAVMADYRFNRYDPMVLDYYAEKGDWDNALDYAQRYSSKASIMTAHIVNHALYHTGRLPDDMFDFPQFRDGRVLFLGVGDKEQDISSRAANRRSDVYYHLGRIDQAERWANEVLSSQGFHGFVLRRLVSINVLKNRPRAARVYAGVMQKTITHRSQANELIAQFNNGELLKTDDEISDIRRLLPKVDYVGEWTARDLLTQQLREAPDNQMAFEYLMAHFLITGNINEFGRNVHRVESFGYQALPRAYEEACVVYMLATGKRPPDLGLNVQEDTLERFRRFMAVIEKYDRDQRQAWDILQPDFGNTYWFFKVFGRSGSVPPPSFDRKKTKL
ncbi:MAG: hypothetical protein JXX14_03215 [Deltaproteobacteria bacterium]|nr:hypothetical protein [Deltaproteobacteria bacterium]